ncbi:hypothetical protein ABEX44_30025 [Priestia megaterium]
MGKYVPKSGQSGVVEGELIRAIEKLRCEAQDNGNANWDAGFEMLGSYILEILNDDDVFQADALSDRLIDHVIEWHFAKNGPIEREKNLNLYR